MLFIFQGLWQLSYSGGNFVGPSVAGVLVEEWGYRGLASVFFVLYGVVALCNVVVHAAVAAVMVRKEGRDEEDRDHISGRIPTIGNGLAGQDFALNLSRC